MRAPARIGLYAAGLGVVFVASAAIAGAVVPEGAAPPPATSHAPEQHVATGDAPEQESTTGADMMRGLSLEQDGYTLGAVEAPGTVGEAGELAFTLADPAGEPVTEFDVAHEQRLHLIVVRSDGAHFRHVHPVMDADGRWSLPWTWDAAGTYRVYADAAPSAGDAVTLTRTVDVAGDLAPARATEVSTTTSVDGYDVALDGHLEAGTASRLTVEVTHDGQPVTTLEPYLGAYGHLVALRDGDLAYLHVHPEGDEPEAGQVSGPTVSFGVEAPTPGRYLLYLDFQVEGQVRTAAFVVEATADGAPAPDDAPAAGHDPATHDH
ncbi:heavy-metal-associated domain-containing protein [Cellulosimicrobium protaetiae]|uniref:Heavy-metal-associated domain-containing protein n=1 Tax=Cellulosimicrobium protaetiae TaxID=2587808 RepID=A0A6M5UL43_9MICO|nr:heavy-metal-associated domain-containing protein [Cellulosimicrobium protaetiae]QJW38103.1 heavy-metal-associated domain-containing protein [Cellulosimicrobium protaetiae]